MRMYENPAHSSSLSAASSAEPSHHSGKNVAVFSYTASTIAERCADIPFNLSQYQNFWLVVSTQHQVFSKQLIRVGDMIVRVSAGAQRLHGSRTNAGNFI